MTLRRLVALAVLSTAGFMPATLRGQGVQAPRNFEAFADGGDIVARWSAADDADLYVGEVDEDPRFGSPSSWAVRDEGGRTFEHRIRGLRSGTYYVRLRALESFLVIKRQSDWTHVERVVVGRDAGRGVDRGRLPDRGDRDVRTTRDPRDFPVFDHVPHIREVDVSGDDILVVWSPVRGADRYLVELDTDGRFRDPFTFGVEAFSEHQDQEFVIRNVPPDRYFLRVRAVESFVSLGRDAWSSVAVVDVGRRNEGDFRRGTDHGRREVDLRGHRRGHPVFDEHPGQGKGHVRHGDHDGDDHDWEDHDRDDHDEDDDDDD